jgi:O-antigen/teichoic acid export membrane protein
VSGITLFILYKFIYHTLGAANLGLWSLVLATTGVARFTDLGLSGSLGRFVARYRALNDIPRAVLAVETGVISVIVLVAGLGVTGVSTPVSVSVSPCCLTRLLR